MKNLLTTSFLAAAALVGTTVSAYAQDPEWIDLELGKEYTIEKGTIFYGKYTAETDGLHTVWGNLGVGTAATDPESLGNVTIPGWTFAGYPYHNTFNAKAGQTYYFSSISQLSDRPVSYTSTFKIEAMEGPEITSCDPEQGSMISPTGFAQILINFNLQPTFEKVTMTVGNITEDVSTEDCRAGNSAICIEYKTILADWLSAGKVKEGDEIIFTVSGVRCSGDLFNGDGIVTVKYVCAKEPMHYLNCETPEKFLSYFKPDSSNGTVTFNFDREVGSAQQVAVIAGYVSENEEEDGKFYMEDDVPYTIEGNKLIVDLRGRSRRLAEMFPTKPTFNPGSVRVQVVGVRDTDGMLAYSPNQGGYANYEVSMPYEQLEVVDPMFRFTPANGAFLQNTDKLNIYLSPVSKFTWDGIKFDYTDAEGDKSITVPSSEITVENGDAADDDAFISLAVPAEVKDAKNVIVTFANLACTDGNDYTDMIKATYNGFVVTEVSPINGSELLSLPAGSQITMKTNLAATYPDLYVQYSITDLNPNDPMEAVVASSEMVRQEDGSYAAELIHDIILWRFHDYELTFTAFATAADAQGGVWNPLGTQTFTYKGLTEPYRYSDVSFVSIEPAPESEITPEERVFTLTFDGMVRLDSDLSFINLGQGLSEPFEKLEANEEIDGASGYCNVWKATVPTSLMVVGPLSLTFKAYDMNSKLVQGNEGVDAQSYFHFDYKIVEETEPVVVNVVTEPAQGEVEELPTSVKLTFEGQTEVVPAGFTGTSVYPMLLFNLGGQELPEPQIGSFDEPLNVCHQEIPEGFTEPGTYIISYPEGAFLFGANADVKSPAFELRWEVKDGGQVDPGTFSVTTVPETGKVEVLTQSIQLTFPEYSEAIWADFNGVKVDKPTLTVNDEKIELEYPTYPDDYDAPWNQLQQNLPQEYTEAGKYEIFYPANSFLFNGSTEIGSPEFTLTWLIGDVAVDELYGEAGSTLNVFTVDGVKVLENGNADDIKGLAKGLYIINGKKVILR